MSEICVSQNFDKSCNVSGKPCSRRIDLIAQYTSHANPEIVPADFQIRDTMLLNGKLAELHLAASLLNCSGSTEDGVCPTGESMDSSVTRHATLNGLRRIRSLIFK